MMSLGKVWLGAIVMMALSVGHCLTESGPMFQQIHLSLGENESQMVVTYSTLHRKRPRSYVSYGESEEKMDQIAKPEIDLYHGYIFMYRARLVNLKPGQKYYYRIIGRKSSNVFHFVALRDDSEWFPTFAIYGDLGLTDDSRKSLPFLNVDVTIDQSVDMIFHVGDFAYNLEDRNCQQGNDFMNSIQSVASRVPYLTCPGNHEFPNNFTHYNSRFSMMNLKGGQKSMSQKVKRDVCSSEFDNKKKNLTTKRKPPMKVSFREADFDFSPGANIPISTQYKPHENENQDYSNDYSNNQDNYPDYSNNQNNYPDYSNNQDNYPDYQHDYNYPLQDSNVFDVNLEKPGTSFDISNDFIGDREMTNQQVGSSNKIECDQDGYPYDENGYLYYQTKYTENSNEIQCDENGEPYDDNGYLYDENGKPYDNSNQINENVNNNLNSSIANREMSDQPTIIDSNDTDFVWCDKKSGNPYNVKGFLMYQEKYSGRNIQCDDKGEPYDENGYLYDENGYPYDNANEINENVLNNLNNSIANREMSDQPIINDSNDTDFVWCDKKSGNPYNVKGFLMYQEKYSGRNIQCDEKGEPYDEKGYLYDENGYEYEDRDGDSDGDVHSEKDKDNQKVNDLFHTRLDPSDDPKEIMRKMIMMDNQKRGLTYTTAGFPTTEPPTTKPPRTEPPRTEPPRTEPPITWPPRTEPPRTEPPRTEPPRTEPPRTEPPRTEPPTTEPPTTEPPTTEHPRTELPHVAHPFLENFHPKDRLNNEHSQVERPHIERTPVERPHIERTPVERPHLERLPVERPHRERHHHMKRPHSKRLHKKRPHKKRRPHHNERHHHKIRPHHERSRERRPNDKHSDKKLPDEKHFDKKLPDEKLPYHLKHPIIHSKSMETIDETKKKVQNAEPKTTIKEQINNFFYSVDVGPAHVVMFNTEFYYFTKFGWDQIQAQYNFLEKDLKEANENRDRRPWIIVMSHRSLYCFTKGDKKSCNHRKMDRPDIRNGVHWKEMKKRRFRKLKQRREKRSTENEKRHHHGKKHHRKHRKHKNKRKHHSKKKHHDKKRTHRHHNKKSKKRPHHHHKNKKANLIKDRTNIEDDDNDKEEEEEVKEKEIHESLRNVTKLQNVVKHQKRTYGLERLFYRYGVDLQFYGHEHYYVRLLPLNDFKVAKGTTNSSNPYENPNAPIHIITSSAGSSKKRPEFSQITDWIAFHTDDYGYTRLQFVDRLHLRLEQTSDSKNGKVIDSIDIVKTDPMPNWLRNYQKNLSKISDREASPQSKPDESDEKFVQNITVDDLDPVDSVDDYPEYPDLDQKEDS